MAVIGGLLFFSPLVLLVLIRAQVHRDAILRSVAEALTIWGAGILLLTELLSRFDRFAHVPLTVGYLIANAALLTIALRTSAFHLPRPWLGLPVLVGLFAVLCLSTLLVAVLAAPNNLDSQVYHLPRVLQWVQAGSVDHFATGSIWQTGYPPFGEYLVANLHLLVGGDQLAGLPQWIAYVGSALMVAWITRALGGDERASFFSAAIALGTLGAVAESATTQMDLAGALWALVVVGFAVNRCHPVWIGIAFGLAMLTKSTVVIFVWPFLIVWFLRTCRESVRRGLLAGLIAGLCAVITVAPYAIRNLYRFGSPVAGGDDLLNEHIGPRTAISVALRWLGSSLATPSQKLNGLINDQVGAWHLLNGIQLNDPSSSVTPFFVVWWKNENFQSSPLTVALVLIAFLVVPLLYAERRGGGTVLAYLICSGVGFLSTMALLRYQYYGIRLALGSLLIAVPLTGLMLRRWGPAGIALVAATGIWATWQSVTSEARPLWGEHSIVTASRQDQMFRYFNPEWRASYESAAQVVDDLDASVIGTYHDLAYPLWVLVNAPEQRKIVNLDETDRALYEAGPPGPVDVIICSHEGFSLQQGRCWQGPGDGWTLVRDDSYLAVFVPNGSSVTPPGPAG